MVNTQNTESHSDTAEAETPVPERNLFQIAYDGNDDEIKTFVSAQVNAAIAEYGFDDYLLLFLFDEWNNISNHHADRLYEAASANHEKNVFLFVHSNGGSIEPAYLISKSLKRLTRDKFIVVIPRRAKSAATLIALGADEIHMGLMSQLGPIDPQLGGYPALALINALDFLAEVATRFPSSSDMLSKYLSDKLDLRTLGYFRRVSESAVQYAERLLAAKILPNGRNAANLANFLVNHYKDHGFVIDVDESKSLLGDAIVKERSREYEFANDIFQKIDLLALMLSFWRKTRLQILGTAPHGVQIFDAPKASTGRGAVMED